ncbi:unnamed protein product, partial [Vitis vinifera]|uniref:Uncharacterized protein n=1 Tax=Vitis vinifera TaxID=29760 RepID=D7TNG8_VITVI
MVRRLAWEPLVLMG